MVYPPMKPDCACLVCGGCNRLESEFFTGFEYCSGCDDDLKRRRPEQMKLDQTKIDPVQEENNGTR